MCWAIVQATGDTAYTSVLRFSYLGLLPAVPDRPPTASSCDLTLTSVRIRASRSLLYSLAKSFTHLLYNCFIVNLTMARKAAQSKAKASSPLDGCLVAISGRFSGTNQGALQTRITDLGGSIASKVTSDTDIVIATEKDFEAKTIKIADALSNNIPIVSLDWLEDTEESNSKADETQFLLDKSNKPATTTAPAANGKKRAAAASNSPAPSQDASQSKKRKTLTDKTDIEDVKVGDGQNAKSKKVQVPVDEYCGAAHYEVYIDDDGLIWDASLNQTNATANNNKFYKIQVSSVRFR
jgi:poly [ADP-ribose] polymerase